VKWTYLIPGLIVVAVIVGVFVFTVVMTVKKEKEN